MNLKKIRIKFLKWVIFEIIIEESPPSEQHQIQPATPTEPPQATPEPKYDRKQLDYMVQDQKRYYVENILNFTDTELTLEQLSELSVYDLEKYYIKYRNNSKGGDAIET